MRYLSIKGIKPRSKLRTDEFASQILYRSTLRGIKPYNAVARIAQAIKKQCDVEKAEMFRTRNNSKMRDYLTGYTAEMSPIFLILFPCGAFILGLILGSFINALSFRYASGEGMGGRSHCRDCGQTLSALDLIPVFSFLYLRGRCRHCNARISLQYPLVECAAGGLSLLVFFIHPQPLAYGFFLVFWMGALFVVVYDLQYLLLPLSALWFLGVLSFLSLFFSCVGQCFVAAPSALALASGPLLGLPLLLISGFSGGRLMGWGDGWLMLSFGWLLGVGEGLFALLIACWAGALVGLLLVWSSSWRKGTGGFTMKSAIPFAPFLAFGAAAAYFLHVDIFSLLLKF